jgi:SAM-dependent methyltransferase
VLELACGEGLYARQLKQRGAARVVGVDNSEAMIAHARHLEASAPLGIEYLVRDAAAIVGLGTFDVVAATHLFHYAPTRSALREMCLAARACLASGGCLVSIGMNPGIHVGDPAYYAPYGFQIHASGRDGERVVLASVIPEMPFQIEAYYWSRESYEVALHEAGFQDVVWHETTVAPEGVAAFGEAYWEPYVRQPHAVVLSARVSSLSSCE